MIILRHLDHFNIGKYLSKNARRVKLKNKLKKLNHWSKALIN